MPKSDEQKAVSVYMPLELYQQLMEFKNQENLRSDSQAVNLLVERQLDDSTTPDRNKAPYQRLSQLEETISDIASRLKQVESQLQNLSPEQKSIISMSNLLLDC